MTTEQLNSLNLGITIDATTEIILNAGIEWLEKNTTIDTADLDNFPNCAKLFLIKFSDVQSTHAGVTSESIQGLSQSFNTGDKSAMLWDIADSLLGDYLIGTVRFVCASPRWR